MICGRLASSLTFKLSSLVSTFIFKVLNCTYCHETPYYLFPMIFQSLKSGTASSLGCKADFFTDQTLYNAVAPSTLPKKPLSAYMLFCQEERPKVTKLYPAMKIGQVAQELGKRYKSLSDHQKKPYLELTQKNSANYKEEMAALKKTEEGKLLLAESRKKSIEKKIKKATARITSIKKSTGYPKRSLAMASFLGDHINRSNPSLEIKARFAQAILAWKNLSEPNKLKYKNKAEADNKDLPRRIQSWETANPDAVTELKELSKTLANLRERLNPKPKKKVVKKRKAVKKVVKKKKVAKKPKKVAAKKPTKKVAKKA